MNKKQKQILIGIIITIFLILVVNAKFNIFSFQPINNPLCIDEIQLCLNPFIDDVTNEVFCDINDIVKCPREWDSDKNMWIGGCINIEENGEIIGTCANGTSPIPPPECSEGHKRCCYSPSDCKNPITRTDGDVYKCINGKWIFYENCDSIGCKEFGTSAQCEEKWYYCLGITDCFLSDTKFDYCYDTVEECRLNIGICCKRIDAEIYEWRKGSCLSGELERQGTQWTKEYCESLSKCELERCEDCGKEFQLCSLAECESCVNELGCEFTPKFPLGGTCKSKWEECDNCFTWLWNKIKEEYHCSEIDVWEFKLGEIVGWDKGPAIFSVSQKSFCPIFLVGIGFIIVLIVLIINILIKQKKKSKKRK